MLQRLAHPATIDDLLLYRLSHLLAVAGGPVIRLCEGQFGITRREWRIVALLAHQPELMSSQLAERADLDRARTSRAITSLVAKKLLSRQVQPGDRRKVALQLTPSGRAVHDALFPLVLAIHHQLLAEMAPAEVQMLDAALQALQTRARALDGTTKLPKANRRRGSAMKLR